MRKRVAIIAAVALLATLDAPAALAQHAGHGAQETHHMGHALVLFVVLGVVGAATWLLRRKRQTAKSPTRSSL